MKNVKLFVTGDKMVLEDGKWVSYTEEQFNALYFICDQCGNACPRNDGVDTVDEHHFCSEECAKDAGYAQCDSCGDWVLRANMCQPNAHELYCCEACANDEGWCRCSHCNSWIGSDNAVWVDDDTPFCDDECAHEAGYYWCDHCETWNSNTCYLNDINETWCRDCLDEDAYCCDDCGEYFGDRDSVVYDEDTDGYYCEDCYERRRSPICSYHTSKNRGVYSFLCTKMQEKRSDVPYMGFELEVDEGCSRRDAAKEINDAAPGVFFFENDGSLGSYGFEIISQPASILWHIEHRGLYEELRCIARNYDYTSHQNGNCGFHIHVDKQFFGDGLDVATAKLLFLFERHWDNLFKFARRESTRWCHRYKEDRRFCKAIPNGKQIVVDYPSIVTAAKQRELDRYHAVNLTNTHTIEIRLWRGTLNVQTMMATLKFTARLCVLAKTRSAVELAAMSFSDLLGDDPDILAYWATRNPSAPAQSDDSNTDNNAVCVEQ